MPYANRAHKAANDRKNYLRRRTLRIARERARQAADPEGYKARMRAYYLGAGRENSYRALYGIGVEDYDRMLAAQGGRCAICGTDKPSKKRIHFAVDHCHKTGRVRGLICIRCNSNLDWYEENAQAVTRYLLEVK